ncbi:MAG TPA: AMP-binding protein [Mycobacteriales bacterium]|nr:AMP-binding protein [Mycobacteriales bacterium]
MTEGRGVAARAAADPDAPAVFDGDRVVSYADLHAQACRLARALHRLGATPGERVAVMLPNGTDYLATGVASAYARLSFIPVNWHLKADELGWLLADSGARVLVADGSLAGYVELALAQAPDCRVLTVGELAAPVTGSQPLAEVVAGEPAELPDGAWPTPNWMFYTSGTTGRPKGVVHGPSDGGQREPDATTVARGQEGLLALWGITAADRYLLAGPGYHAGPGGYAFAALYAGGAVVVQQTWDAATWLRLVDRHRATYSFLTPAHFIRLLELPPEARQGVDLSSLRLVIHGGAPCPTDVKRRILDLLPNAEVSELYGASEGGVSRITAAEWRERPGSVGKPWPGVEVRILDDTGARLPPGQTGRIFARPAGGARFSYYKDDAKTAAAWHDGAFTVGDIGHLDEDGYLYITDRASDMVLWGGVNVYPREIEDVLHGHPAVVDCAVVGVPDERYGERLVAVVELRAPAEERELQDHVRAHLADFKVPAQVVPVAAVPRDPNGKVRKWQLRDQLARDALSSPAGA